MIIDIKKNIEELISISTLGTGEEIRSKVEEFVPTYNRLDKKEEFDSEVAVSKA